MRILRVTIIGGFYVIGTLLSLVFLALSMAGTCLVEFAEFAQSQIIETEHSLDALFDEETKTDERVQTG